MELGLAISRLTLQSGETRTVEELAAFCNCRPYTIQRIESIALQKMKRRLQAFIV